MKSEENLIWIDLEMTGLDPEQHRIIEIATIVTDKNLQVLGEGPILAIHQVEDELSKMDDWCVRTHGDSGLTARVKASTMTEAIAEQQTIEFLAQYIDAGVSPMCGNSIGQDRRFIYKYMPKLAEFFHYRNLDVSTLKELAKRWAPDVMNAFNKQSRHLAMDDIKDSIAELAHYREHFLKF